MITFTIQWDGESLQIICDRCGDQVVLIEDDNTRDHATDNILQAEGMYREMCQHALDRHGQHYQP